MVSKINYDARSVTVEWYERNETKGKEVEMDAILQLNAELMREEHEAASMPKIIKQTSANPLSRVSNFDHCLLYAFSSDKLRLGPVSFCGNIRIRKLVVVAIHLSIRRTFCGCLHFTQSILTFDWIELFMHIEFVYRLPSAANATFVAPAVHPFRSNSISTICIHFNAGRRWLRPVSVTSYTSSIEIRSFYLKNKPKIIMFSTYISIEEVSAQRPEIVEPQRRPHIFVFVFVCFFLFLLHLAVLNWRTRATQFSIAITHHDWH